MKQQSSLPVSLQEVSGAATRGLPLKDSHWEAANGGLPLKGSYWPAPLAWMSVLTAQAVAG